MIGLAQINANAEAEEKRVACVSACIDAFMSAEEEIADSGDDQVARVAQACADYIRARKGGTR